MLRLLIVDDELPARNRLRRLLKDIPAVFVAGEATNGQQALELVRQLKPDVLLLDISMPGLDGMGLARLLQSQESAPAIIFCTAGSEQAVEAFECEALDYLVKPVRVERLEAALDKARNRTVGSEQAGPYLRSTLAGKVSLLPLADVLYIHAEDKYTVVVHESGSQVFNQSLSELENQYAELLLRVHRSTLVAKNRIRGLEKSPQGHNYLLLDGSDEQLPVSRRKLPWLRKLIRDIS